MAIDVVDLLFYFWLTLTAAVIGAGHLIDKHKQSEKDKVKKSKRQQDERQARGESSWRHQDNLLNLSHHNQYNNEHQQHDRQNYWSAQDSRLYTESNYNQTFLQHDQASADNSNLWQLPTASGFDESCVDYVNQVLKLLYLDHRKFSSQIGESVCRSLNERLLATNTNDGNSSKKDDTNASSWQRANLMTNQNRSIRFERLNLISSSPVELANVRTETEADGWLSVAAKVYIRRLEFIVSIYSSDDQKLQRHYPESCRKVILCLDSFECKLRALAMTNDKLIVIQLVDKPNTRMSLRPFNDDNTFTNQGNDLDEREQDAIISSIVSALEELVIDLHFGDQLDFPAPNLCPRGVGISGSAIKDQQYQRQQQQQSKYRRKLNALRESASEIKRQIKLDFFSSTTTNQYPQDHSIKDESSTLVRRPNCNRGNSKEQKLFVKLCKASNINYNQQVTCLLDLDEPRQLFVSAPKCGSSPVFDEHFLFALNDESCKLSLELWDCVGSMTSGSPSASPSSNIMAIKESGSVTEKKNALTSMAKFLGSINIDVSASKLRQMPSQRLGLSLCSQLVRRASITKARGDHSSQLTTNCDDLSDSIGGELNFELLYIEHSTKRKQSTISSDSKRTRPLRRAASELSATTGDLVSVDRKLTTAGYVITKTTITRPTQHQEISSDEHRQSRQSRFTTRLLDGIRRSVSPNRRSRSSEPASPTPSSVSMATTATTVPPFAESTTDNETEQHRPRSRSRSLIRALKKRLSFSSSSQNNSLGNKKYRPTSSRSSLDVGTSDQQHIHQDDRHRRAASEAPIGAQARDLPRILINKARVSADSAATAFVKPKAQLVIECFDPKMRSDGSVSGKAITRHYAVSEELLSKSIKWTKLAKVNTLIRLFHEHQFLSTPLAAADTCHSCGKPFSRNVFVARRGYKCRTCHLVCHKSCMLVKVDHICPYGTQAKLNLRYINEDGLEEPEETNREQSASSSSQKKKATTGAEAAESGISKGQRNQSPPYRRFRKSNTRSIDVKSDKNLLSDAKSSAHQDR